MNFSDETVERLVGAVQKGRYMASCDIVSGNLAATTKEIDSRILATILSSLTLADLMQVDEVQKAMAESFKNGIDSVNAQKPLTEPKQ